MRVVIHEEANNQENNPGLIAAANSNVHDAPILKRCPLTKISTTLTEDPSTPTCTVMFAAIRRTH
jgi:hypothetical protein